MATPVERLRNTVVAVRALLAGDGLPLDRDDVRPRRLGVPVKPPVPILLAALAPASVRLAGELADEWVPFPWARGRLADGKAMLAEGESVAEDATATRVATSVPLALADDEETARGIAAGWLLALSHSDGTALPAGSPRSVRLRS